VTDALILVVRLRRRGLRCIAGFQDISRTASGRLRGRFLGHGRLSGALVAGSSPPSSFILRQLAHFLWTGRHAVMTFALAIAFELFCGGRLRRAPVSKHWNRGASNQRN
jgi:hypothetical protein